MSGVSKVRLAIVETVADFDYSGVMLPDSVAVLSPHPDDEVLGCGGLLQRVVESGGRAVVWCFHQENPMRLSEFREGLRVLGGDSEVIECPVIDNGAWFDELPMFQLVSTIEGLIEGFRPDALLVPNRWSFHHEHRILTEAAIAACRPSGGTGRVRPRVVAEYEEVTDGFPSQVTREPDWFIELTSGHVDRKWRAMSAHKSQVRPVPSERSFEAIKSFSRVRGAQAGFPYAEAYRTLFRGSPC